MEYAMETSCALKSIVRHHLYMKTGSGFDRTFPHFMMTFVFGRGKTNIQQDFRKEEMDAMKDDQLDTMRNDPTTVSGLIRGTFQAREQRDVHEWLSRFRFTQSADGLYSPQICHQAAKLWAIQGVFQKEAILDSARV